ncbi:MAG: chemotaxis protein MotB [Saprospiraceae bacterium]|jgi:chemotaxis protein MotB
MKKYAFPILALFLMFFSSCKNPKITQLEQAVVAKEDKIQLLEEQLSVAQLTGANLLDQMKTLSIVNKEGAQSIRKSLENMTYVNARMQYKDSLNFELVRNLKRSLSDINDEDVQVEVKGGIVYVSISDNLLFSSGSSSVNNAAQDVLGKIALILNDHSQLNILVEGHTDDIPMQSTSCINDNWDLSTERATSIVRILQNDHYVSPKRLTAAGRASYVPRAQNDTAEGRAQNRRTEILILPRFDQFFKLMESPELAN